MGEIGISPGQFRAMDWWEVRSVIRGYNCRLCQMWSAKRWQTYHIMEAQLGTDNLRKSGIRAPTDLIKLPSDRTPTPDISQEEIDMLQAEMAAMNSSVNP